MGTSFLLRLADIGILPRRIERLARERRFRNFWDDVETGRLTPDVIPARADASPRAAAGVAGEAASVHRG
ncbi:MAG: hypothetical protein QOJ34_972 [Pseudonocardiales bacterium]|nr:hypothetical protein [Pseudonocardiales bacterium]